MADQVFIQAIGFGESMVEITYMEARDTSEDVALIRTCVFSADALAEEVADLQDVAASVLDEALILLRLGGRKKTPEAELDDDDDATDE